MQKIYFKIPLAYLSILEKIEKKPDGYFKYYGIGSLNNFETMYNYVILEGTIVKLGKRKYYKTVFRELVSGKEFKIKTEKNTFKNFYEEEDINNSEVLITENDSCDFRFDRGELSSMQVEKSKVDYFSKRLLDSDRLYEYIDEVDRKFALADELAALYSKPDKEKTLGLKKKN